MGGCGHVTEHSSKHLREYLWEEWCLNLPVDSQRFEKLTRRYIRSIKAVLVFSRSRPTWAFFAFVMLLSVDISLMKNTIIVIFIYWEGLFWVFKSFNVFYCFIVLLWPTSTRSPNCMAQNTHQRTCMPAVWHQCFVYQGSCFLLLKYISATRLKTTAKWCCLLEKGCSYARQIGHCPLELWHKLFIFALEEHLTHCSLPNEFQTNWFRKVPLGWFGRQCNGKLWSTVFTEQQEGKGEVESSVAKWSLVTQTSVVSVEMCIKGYTHQTLCWQLLP